MKSAYLKTIIVSTLGRQQLTSDQILAQLHTDERIREIKLGRPRLVTILRAMIDKGELSRVIEACATGDVRRYYIPTDSYVADKSHSTSGWCVIKYDEGHFNGTVIGSNLTESDARTCAAALNARDCKVRGST